MTLLGMWDCDDSVLESNMSATGNAVTGAAAAAAGGSVGGCTFTRGDGITWTIPATGNLVLGFRYRVQASPDTTRSWLLLGEGAVNHLALRFNGSGQIAVYRGDAGTLLATSTFVWPTVGVYAYVEVKAVIADSGGSVEVKVDGTTVVSFSGDTRNAGTSGVIDRFQIGTFLSGSGSAIVAHADDVYALTTAGSAPYNDYLGDVSVRKVLPSGDGDSSGWLGSDGNSVANYQLVDEQTPTMTDYVGASASGTTDLYQMADIPTTYDVLAIQEVIYAQKSDTGTSPVLLPFAKGQSGGTRADTALPALSTTAQALAADIRTTDPDGNALTAARVNAMQVGVKIS